MWASRSPPSPARRPSPIPTTTPATFRQHLSATRSSPLLPSAPSMDIYHTPAMPATSCSKMDYSFDCIVPPKSGLVNVARTMLDEEISVLEEQLCVLKHRRNDLAPVLRLPPEILAEIFILSSYQVDHTSGDLWCKKLAQVCRYFRAIALDCPRLWCRFPLCGERWVDETLRRARLLPLSVHCNVSPDCKSSGLDRIAEEIHRIRQLSVYAIPHLLPMNHFWRHFMKPAPSLEVFSAIDPFQIREHTASHVPSDIFAGETPSLRKIEIRQCTFCWHSALFRPTITSLVLQGHRICFRPVLYEVMSALSVMPLLEAATLDQVLPDIPWDFDPGAKPDMGIAMNRLTYLYIDGLALNTAALLNQLHLPALKHLVLSCQPFRRYEELSVLAYSLRGKFDDGADPTTLSSFTFRSPTPETLQLQAWTTELTLDELRSQCPPPPSLNVRVSWDGASPNNSVKSLLLMCQSLPVRGVRTAHLPDYVSLTSRAWLEIFGRFAALEQLAVDGRTANHLPAALSEEACEPPLRHAAAEDDEDEEGPCALFPALRVLRLEDVDFAGDECPQALFFAQLQEAVMDRRHRGPRLHLDVHYCRNFIKEQMDDLEMLGAVVRWDEELLLNFELDEVDSESSEEEYEDYYMRED